MQPEDLYWNEMANNGNIIYGSIVKQMKLQEYYPKRLNRENVLRVSKEIISSDELKDPGKIPWFILQNLITCNYEGLRFEVNKNSTNSNSEQSFSSLLQAISEETNFGDDTDQVSPADALIALFMCCDNFVRQLLVEKLSTCQLAIPLLLPDCNQNYEMLLWAMRTLRKQWKTRDHPACEQSMVLHPLPIVSALRLGRPMISKSKILNSVINDLKHDIFFHSGCKGGTLNRKITNGVLEIAWYLPSGKSLDAFSDALTFMNLRGNASDLKCQSEFTSRISLATIAFTTANDFKEKDTVILKSLYEQNGHLLLVVDGSPGEMLKNSLQSVEKSCHRKKNKQIGLISSLNKNELTLGSEIRKKLISIFADEVERPTVPDKSIQMCFEVAKEMELDVDETTDCQKAMSSVEKMLHVLQQSEKKEELPLQFITKEIGEIKKEEHRLLRKGNTQTETYVDKLKSDMKSRRRKQDNLYKHPTTTCKTFKNSFKYSVLQRKYFYGYVKIITDRNSMEKLQPKRHEYVTKWNALCDDVQRNENREAITKETLKSKKKELDKLELELGSLSLGLEHFNREIGQVYEMSAYFNQLNNSTREFADVAAEMLLHGYPLELMDGDASHVPLTWIEAVLTSLKNKIGNKRIFVLSVLGIQSSGKSTMLNAMFGLQFAVSAGKCTKGIFAQLIPLDISLQKDTNCDYIMVVDTEGLRSPEVASIQHEPNRDNEMATFVIGLGDATIINIMGENAADMQDCLQIAVHAFIKMENVNIQPSCLFVHQNVTDVTASDMNTTQKRKLRGLLDDITRIAAEEEKCSDKYRSFSDVINFQENKHVMYVSSLWQGDPPMAPPNPGYSRCILHVKKQVIEFMQKGKAKTVEEFKCRFSDIWKAILCQNFVFSFKNSLEIQAYNALQTEYLKHSRTLRHNAMTYSDKLERECKNVGADKITEYGNSILGNYIKKLINDVDTLKGHMDKYFSEEVRACQWKGRIQIDIKLLWEENEERLKKDFYSICRRVTGRAKIDKDIKRYEIEILEDAKMHSKTFQDKQLTENEIELHFSEIWGKWISKIPPSDITEHLDNSHFENIVQKSSINKDEVSKILTKGNFSHIQVCEDDLQPSSVKQLIRRVFGHAESMATCLDAAKDLTENIHERALQKIECYIHEGKNYNQCIGEDIFSFLFTEFTDMKIHGKIPLKPRSAIQLTICRFYLLVPKFKEMQKQYKQENDLINYMASQKDGLWQTFRDERMKVQVSVTAASMVSQKLESAIRISLPSYCKTGIVDRLRTSNNRVFANKMSLHAQLLIDIAEERNFMSYRKYLANPVACLKTGIANHIKTLCFKKNENGNTLLQEEYVQEVHKLFKIVKKAVDDSCAGLESTCTMGIWWPKLIKHIGSELSIKENIVFFIKNKSFQVVNLQNSLSDRLENIEKEMIEAFQSDVLFKDIQEPCRQFFEKDLVGCLEVCPFCKAPCDLQAGSKNDDHRTEYHRPQGIAGYRWETTHKLCVDVCTTSVMTDNRFRNKDTGDQWHPYKEYQNLNEYYKAWKIQPVDSESQLYWKWFMATYNEKLAEYYDCEKADIPDGWKEISWKSAKQEMINTYNL